MNTQLVHLSNNRLVTTSLEISNHFGKKHKDVLKAIHNLDCSSEFTERNFELCHKINELQNNKPQPYYEITRDGFVFLCMGFTGAAAAQWKERYINAFNQMENRIVTNQTQLQALKTAYLQANPNATKLLRYYELGLKNVEIAKLLNVADSTVSKNLRKLAALGFCTYQYNANQAAKAKLAHAKMLENKQTQQSLDLGE
ncbi:MAG: Rha family transcriptional regulator [Alysiella sp.]|uniref:Rha family transcriptional regulator n=1 Tax=Alysiella sp. TaxID=1872483 RepID=UPI0026DD8F64|nr:Rha family transcriptional regulator [Alysiella sp.]MDO4434381.1 Rha family transcriptional regulator [Alysiella sp.]